MAVNELCRKLGFSEASYNLWRSKFGGMDGSDAAKKIGNRPGASRTGAVDASARDDRAAWPGPGAHERKFAAVSAAAGEQLHIQRRRRKKIPVSERQPLLRPGRADEVWSMDFVFVRAASGRTIKCLVIVDDATHEAVAIT